MTNPYEPPTTNAMSSTRGFYAGGLSGIATVSIIIGAVVGGLLDVFARDSAPLTVLAITTIAWLVATSLLFYLIGDSNLTEDGKVLFALLLPIPAYALYVPVCMVSSVFTMPFLGEMQYGPSSSGLIVGEIWRSDWWSSPQSSVA